MKQLNRKNAATLYVGNTHDALHLPFRFAGTIVITGGTPSRPLPVSLAEEALHIIRRGACAEVRGAGRVRVEGGHVYAYGREIYLRAGKDSYVEAHGHVRVISCGGAVVHAYGRTQVRASGGTVELEDETRCLANGRTVVHAHGHSRVVIGEDAQIYPGEDCRWRRQSWSAFEKGNPFWTPAV